MVFARLAACGAPIGCRLAVHTQLRGLSLAPLIAPTSFQAARAAGGPAALPPGRRSAGRSFATAAGESPHYDDTKQRVNVYTSYTVYKGKAAMAVKVIKPTWQNVSSGLQLSREGTVLLEFADVLPGATEPRKYDWEQKLSIALSAVECARVLEVTDSRAGTADSPFFHDPSKGGSGEGSVNKTLSINPGKDKGWFFSLAVAERGAAQPRRVLVPVDDQELRLIKTLLQFLMPRLLGFDEMFNGPPTMPDASGTGGAPAAGGGAPF